MSVDATFQPNWASPTAQTIHAILENRGISMPAFRDAISVPETDFSALLDGQLKISSVLAKRLAEQLGSTPRFWLERDKQYHAALEQLRLSAPELTRWAETFPIREMVRSRWLEKPESREDIAADLLEYFGVATLTEWRVEYQARLRQTQFRTSKAFENSVAATTAWIRHGELVAESMDCGLFSKEGFRESLTKLKPLTNEASPCKFIPQLQRRCAEHGVAVVVAKCAPGCAASGATYVLESGQALLLLSGRFLSDDQFWFSFFHEAGHLVLHSDEACVEETNATDSRLEDEANQFAQEIILEPEGEASLQKLMLNKFAIARFARRCNVSPGLIVGQLQHRNRISPKAYGPLKVRYKAEELILEKK